ncbi:MAG TPA: acyltransferase [Pyrinomonadaceae bacterium]|nr:acyltransferase [Pyrinomonadaceae bacterium]
MSRANSLTSSIETKTSTSTFAGGRLRSIDALRGAAALAVVLYHAVGQAPQDEKSALIHVLAAPVRALSAYGYAGVFLFFVISGFCIHLHWAKARAASPTAATPKVAFVPFWKRRILRLYPPYLIALALYLLLPALKNGVVVDGFFLWDTALHLLMLHNFDPHTVYSINGVFWTLAIEEQLYLAYFLLLFIRRRWGWKWTLITCAAARVVWVVLCIVLQRTAGVEIPVPESAASHWFTWALGALGVEAMYGLVALPRLMRDLRVAAAALLSAVGLSLLLPVIVQHSLWHTCAWLLLHPLWGVGFFIVINRAVLAERNWREWFDVPRLVRWSATVGLFSYSLYLIHQLVLMEMWRFWILRMPTILVALLVSTPLSVACSYLFFRYCERPFLPRPAKSPVTVATPPAHLTPDPLLNESA